jgi:hypothetical protein
MAQIGNALLTEATFAQLDLPMICGQQSEDLEQMLQMFFPRGAVDQNIIEEYNNTFAKKWLECSVHGALEGVGCSSEAECHDCKLEVAPMGLESCLVFLPGREAYLVEACTQVKTRKPSGRRELIQQLINEWYGKFARDCESIEHAVVNTKPPRPVLLADKQHRGGKGTRTGLNKATVQHCGNLLFYLIL